MRYVLIPKTIDFKAANGDPMWLDDGQGKPLVKDGSKVRFEKSFVEWAIDFLNHPRFFANIGTVRTANKIEAALRKIENTAATCAEIEDADWQVLKEAIESSPSFGFSNGFAVRQCMPYFDAVLEAKAERPS